MGRKKVKTEEKHGVTARSILDDILLQLNEIPLPERRKYIAYIIWEMLKALCELQKMMGE